MKIVFDSDRYRNINIMEIYLSIKSNVQELFNRDAIDELFNEIDRWYGYDDKHDDEWLKCVIAWLLVNKCIDIPEFKNDRINNLLGEMIENEMGGL